MPFFRVQKRPAAEGLLIYLPTRAGGCCPLPAPGTAFRPVAQSLKPSHAHRPSSGRRCNTAPAQRVSSREPLQTGDAPRRNISRSPSPSPPSRGLRTGQVQPGWGASSGCAGGMRAGMEMERAMMCAGSLRSGTGPSSLFSACPLTWPFLAILAACSKHPQKQPGNTVVCWTISAQIHPEASR